MARSFGVGWRSHGGEQEHAVPARSAATPHQCRGRGRAGYRRSPSELGQEGRREEVAAAAGWRPRLPLEGMRRRSPSSLVLLHPCRPLRPVRQFISALLLYRSARQLVHRQQ
ncbi:unnamed protein product [Urochloa humidicola]